MFSSETFANTLAAHIAEKNELPCQVISTHAWELDWDNRCWQIIVPGNHRVASRGLGGCALYFRQDAIAESLERMGYTFEMKQKRQVTHYQVRIAEKPSAESDWREYFWFEVHVLRGAWVVSLGSIWV